MAWPYDRLTTYAAGSQVKSADLNAIEDAIVDLYDENQIKFSAMSGGAPNTSPATMANGGPWVLAGGAAARWRHGADGLVGNGVVAHVISGFVAYMNRVAGTLTVELKRIALDGSEATIGTATRSSTTGWAGTAAVMADPDHVVLAGAVYYFEFTSGDEDDEYAGSVVLAKLANVD